MTSIERALINVKPGTPKTEILETLTEKALAEIIGAVCATDIDRLREVTSDIYEKALPHPSLEMKPEEISNNTLYTLGELSQRLYEVWGDKVRGKRMLRTKKGRKLIRLLAENSGKGPLRILAGNFKNAKIFTAVMKALRAAGMVGIHIEYETVTEENKRPDEKVGKIRSVSYLHLTLKGERRAQKMFPSAPSPE